MANVAQNILQQLGGNKFVVMTGAKNLLSLVNGLQLSLPARMAAKGINRVTVSLNALDLYDVTFGKYVPRDLRVVDVSEFTNIHCENLQTLFVSETGLSVRL